MYTDFEKGIYSFGYQVFTFYTVKMNTDFENIKKKKNIFEVTIHFYSIIVNTWYPNE